MQFKRVGQRLKIYRTQYDPTSLRSRASFVGSVRIDEDGIPADVLTQLDVAEVAEVEAKLASLRGTDAFQVAPVVASIEAATAAAPTIGQSGRNALATAAKALLAALGEAVREEPKAVADAPVPAPAPLDDDDVFVVPTVQKAAPAAPRPVDEVYSVLDDGRLLAKPVAAQTTEDDLPLPSARFRGMVAGRYPNIEIAGLVEDWHADLKSGAVRMPKGTQSAVDESFFFYVPAILRRRLRAMLPALTDREAFAREAEGLSWEHGLTVDGDQLWHYAVALEASNVTFVWMPKTDIIAEDLKAWLETPHKRIPDAVTE